MVTQKSYQIVHLSDPHLTAKDNDKRTQPDIFGALTGMNKSFRNLLKSPILKEADLLIITGDITDKGSITAWKFFWDALQQNNLTKKVLVIPGNHDVCCLDPFALPININKTKMEKLKTGLKLGNQPIRFPWIKVFKPEIVVFGLNSNNAGNWTVATNARGKLDNKQLSAFDNLLNKYQDIPVKIVALHHSPNIPRSDTEKRRGMEPTLTLDRLLMSIPTKQRRAFRSICRNHRVRLVLHGHIHRLETRVVNGLRIIGAPAFTEPDSKGAYIFWRYLIKKPSLRTYAEKCAVQL
ncbi:MAG: metallophosphoesterase [bacterium]